MKPTVDLTADRLFHAKSKERLPSWIESEDKYFQINAWFNTELARTPWENSFRLLSTDADLFTESDPLVGSAANYRKNEEIEHATSTEYCDRCGAKIRTPWRYDRSLCDDCNLALYRELHGKRVPWEAEWEQTFINRWEVVFT
mgnify:CR=1 FL=1